MGEAGFREVTWEQAVARKDTPFHIIPERPKNLHPGAPILDLFDVQARNLTRTPSSNLHEFVIFPEIYGEILQKGGWALKSSVFIPRDAGFEESQEYPPGLVELATQGSYQFEIQKKLERIQVKFDGLEDSKARFIVVSEYSKREVERELKVNGREEIDATPWKKLKEQGTTEIELAQDGAIRFTDGEKIYQIATGFMKRPELTLFTIKPNPLRK